MAGITPSGTEPTTSTGYSSDVPPLPDSATPEQKDLHWFKHVYQGDRMPQLTLRAVLVGGLLGMLMSAANLYTTLAIGWSFGIAITACVLSFVMWNFVVLTTRGKVSQMSVLENACMASTASAAGYSTGSTIATMFGALVLLHDVPEGTPLSSVKTWNVTEPWIVVVFTLCTGLMGVFLAIPMKRQQINHEQLPFPSGMAAAETLRSLYSQSVEALHKAYVLVLGLVLGLLIGLLRAGDEIVNSVRILKKFFNMFGNAIRIPSEIEMHFLDRLYPSSRHAAGFAFEPSALLIAAGMIVGMRTSVSLVASSLLLYAYVGPKISELDYMAYNGASQAVVDAYVKAETDKKESPKDIATEAAKNIEAALTALKLPDDGAAIKKAKNGARAAADAYEAELAARRVELMVDKAEAKGLRIDRIERDVRRAVRDAGESVHAARIGGAMTAAERAAEVKGVAFEPIRKAGVAARLEAEKATDTEVGQKILAAILTAADQPEVNLDAIRKAASEASARSKATPGRDGAEAALKAGLDQVYGKLERDPGSIKLAKSKAAAEANEVAAKTVADTTIDAIKKAAATAGLDAEAIAKAAEASDKRAGEPEAVVRFESARESLEYEASRKNIDVKDVIAEAKKREFTAEEKTTALNNMKQAIIGAATGAAGTAGTAEANRKAYEAKAEAITKAQAENKSFKKVAEAGDAAFEQAKYRPNVIFNWGGPESGVITITRWSLWGGTAVMVFASLMSVALQWRTLVRAFVGGKSAGPVGEHDDALKQIEVPGSWMMLGMVPITVAMVWLQYQAFQVSLYAGIIAVAMSFVLSLVGSRATGETDTTPIGAMGKVMQLMFAVLAPGNTHANLASAGIAANSASSSADLLTDLKTGYLLGANPRKQFLAQFFGVFFGTLAIVPIWYLMVPTREKLESFAIPSTRAWEAVARVLVKGVSELPPSAITAIFVGAAIGCVLPVIEKLTPPKYRGWLPSATGIGLAWVMPFQNAFSFFVGALIALVWSKLSSKSCSKYNIPISSGLIAGESLMAAALAISATVVGLLALQ